MLSHKKEKSPLTQGLNYRSACDLYCGTVNKKCTEIHLAAGLCTDSLGEVTALLHLLGSSPKLDVKKNKERSGKG